MMVAPGGALPPMLLRAFIGGPKLLSRITESTEDPEVCPVWGAEEKSMVIVLSMTMRRRSSRGKSGLRALGLAAGVVDVCCSFPLWRADSARISCAESRDRMDESENIWSALEL
jgi:hypothetical protein